MISVIVPAYNARNTIKRTLDSILGQSYKNIEVIVIDDGSTDDTLRICNEYQQADNRVTVIHVKNSGVSHARNVGIKKAKSRYLCFVDADDYCDKDLLAELRKHMNENDLCVCAVKVVDDRANRINAFNFGSGRVTIEDYLKLLSKGRFNPYFGGPYAKMYKRDILEKNDIKFDEKSCFAEDFRFNMKYLRGCKHIFLVKRELYSYFLNSETSLTKRNYQQGTIENFLYQEIKACYDYSETLKYFDVNHNGLIWIDVWKILVSKTCKSLSSVSESFRALRKARKIFKYHRRSMGDSQSVTAFCYELILTNYAAVFFECLFLYTKHYLEKRG